MHLGEVNKNLFFFLSARKFKSTGIKNNVMQVFSIISLCAEFGYLLKKKNNSVYITLLNLQMCKCESSLEFQ